MCIRDSHRREAPNARARCAALPRGAAPTARAAVHPVGRQVGAPVAAGRRTRFAPLACALDAALVGRAASAAPAAVRATGARVRAHVPAALLGADAAKVARAVRADPGAGADHAARAAVARVVEEVGGVAALPGAVGERLARGGARDADAPLAGGREARERRAARPALGAGAAGVGRGGAVGREAPRGEDEHGADDPPHASHAAMVAPGGGDLQARRRTRTKFVAPRPAVSSHAHGRSPPHRAAQVAGRAAVFADYRLRVAEVRRDYGMVERDQAPPDSRQQHG